MSNQTSSSSEKLSSEEEEEEEEETMGNTQNGAPLHEDENEHRTSHHGSFHSVSSEEQLTTVAEQIAPEAYPSEYDEGTEEHTQQGAPLVPNDDGASQLEAACNVQLEAACNVQLEAACNVQLEAACSIQLEAACNVTSSSNGANSLDQQKEQSTVVQQSVSFSESGNPICQPSCDEMEIPHAPHGSSGSASSAKQTASEETHADKGGIRMMENIQHGEPVISNDDGTSQLGAACACNVPSSANSSNSGYQRVELLKTSQFPRFSESGNQIYQPSCDEMEIPQAQHGSLERVHEELDDAILDPQEIAISESSHTVEEVRYPVEWDQQNNFILSREVRNFMARNPNKVYHVTPCKRVRDDQVVDPTRYLVDSGYHDNTHSSMSHQQPGNSSTSHDIRERNSTELVQPENSTTSHDNRVRNSTEPVQPNLVNTPQGTATGSTEHIRPASSTPPIQLESLGACSTEPSFEVHDHQSQEGCSFPMCDILFVHDGYAMFKLTVPKGTSINTLITMNQFIEQKRALLGDETFYFLQEGWTNLTKIEDNSTIIIKTL